MSLALRFEGRLLTRGNDAKSALIRMVDGTEIPISFQQAAYDHVQRVHKGYYVTSLDKLPVSAQQWVRDTANQIQRRRHDQDDGYEYPDSRRGGLLPSRNSSGHIVGSDGREIDYRPSGFDPTWVGRVPETIELADTLTIIITSHSIYNGRPSLETGRNVTINYGEGHELMATSIGVIKEFVLVH